jgi:6-phosphogluconolactonase
MDSLSGAAARRLMDLAEKAITRSGCFHLTLAGGSTPLSLYRHLASDDRFSRLDWTAVHLYWGDERCVPPDHEQSNFRAAQRTLIDQIPIPEENVHRMPGELEPERGALAYEQLLYRQFRWKTPVFDLVLLGMGADGHTASLFPGDDALGERKRWVVAVDHQAPPPPGVSRLTLTLPLLNVARSVIFLVAGQDKAQAVRRVQQGEDLPAGMVSPVGGDLVWMLDDDAAGGLK